MDRKKNKTGKYVIMVVLVDPQYMDGDTAHYNNRGSQFVFHCMILR